jgi:hypothetical protein
MGGINPRWTFNDNGASRLKWFPKIVEEGGLSKPYYTYADKSTVLVLFHSMAALNPGHLIWDDLLPVYNLLSMFGFADVNVNKEIVRLQVDGDGMWAGCDQVDMVGNKAKCENNFRRWLPAFGFRDENPETPKTVHEAIHPKPGKDGTGARYVCTKDSVAGMGLLTDHGLKAFHGRTEDDYEYSFNVGRGPVLYDFRNYMLSHLALPTVTDKEKIRIVFSVGSSTSLTRNLYYKKQLEVLKEVYSDDDDVVVESHQFSKMTVFDQVELTTKTSILVTSAGGGAVTGMFLDRGSSIIIYYDDTGRDGGKQFNYPARLDWDYFNNCAYLRTSWLPIKGMDKDNGIEVFKKVIAAEIEGIWELGL